MKRRGLAFLGVWLCVMLVLGVWSTGLAGARVETITFTVTFSVVNGAWDDDTTADKVVKLSRRADEDLILVLSEDQIPAVGHKPDEGCSAGDWDVVPTTEMVVSHDAAYIYTYAQTGKKHAKVTKDPVPQTLIYTGKDQELVSAGTAENGTMVYGISGNNLPPAEWSSSIPKKTEAGKYIVWFKAKADEGYLDSAARCCNAEIQNAAMTVSAEDVSVPYDGKAHTITVSVTVPAGGAVIKYGRAAGACDLDTPPAITDAGKLTVYYLVTAANYSDVAGSADVEITKVKAVITSPPAAKVGLVAGDQAQELVTAGTAEGGTMRYALGTDDKTAPAAGWNTAIPAGKDAGTYYVWYCAKGDANHLDSDAACVLVTIAEPAPTPTPPPSGRVLPKLEPKGDNALKLSWTKMNNVDGYDIYFIDCHKIFKSTPTASVGADVSEYVFKGLKKQSMHKACVRAYVMENGVKSYVSERMDVHSIVGGSSEDYTVPAKVRVKDLTLAVGGRQKINPTIVGKEKGKKVLSHNDGKIWYISLDPSVATVSADGTVRAAKEGSAKILVIACNGEKATVKVTVGQGLDKLSFGKKKYTVKAGKTIDLYKLLKISPKNAVVSLKWKSGDRKIATVDENGVVTGVKKGTVTITVTDTASGKSATVKIQVKKAKK